MNNLKHSKLVNELIKEAVYQNILSSDPPAQAIARHSPLKEWQKPGRLIMSLSKEDREKVKELTAKDFNHRPF